MKYVIKQYDENGRLVEIYDFDITSVEEAKENIECFEKQDKQDGEEEKYTYEIEEEE